jgi:tryptophan synthase alpha chain
VSRIGATFERLRAHDERALVAYVMAGDPSLADTRRLVVEMARQGADIVELGVPFSDPLADGPVIQRAAARSLERGTSLQRILELVAELRREVDVPIVLMGYYNPLLAFGLAAFARVAAGVGVDGLIVPDLPPEEAGPLAAETGPAGLDIVYLLAPTSGPDRVKLIARASAGFVYVVSVMGVTGARRELPPDLGRQIRTLRLVTTKPICVGFGVSGPDQVEALGNLADGVIVGSAIVRLIEERTGAPSLVKDVGEFVAALKAPLRARATAPAGRH